MKIDVEERYSPHLPLEAPVQGPEEEQGAGRKSKFRTVGEEERGREARNTGAFLESAFLSLLLPP